jgi:hypothetical protein
MKKLVLFAVAVVMAGCGQDGTPRTNGAAAAGGTGGMGAGGNAGATGAVGGGGTNIAGSTATSGSTGGAANGSGGAILPGGSSGSSGGTGGGTTARGGMSTNGGASTNGGMSTNGGTSASSGLSVTTGGQVAQSGGTAGQTTAGTGGAGGSAGNGGSSSQTGGATNQAGASSCNAPDCCVPIALNPSRVDVYQVDGSIIVNLVVEPSDPANITSPWMPYAEITTSWGGTQTCSAERRRGAGVRFLTLQCPAAVPSTPFTCGSPASVQVRLRTETYAETEPFGLVCVGNNTGPSTTITAAVKCPTCPSSADWFGDLPCDYPDPPSGTSITQCSYFLPCTCTVNDSTGVKAWMCPHP